MQTQNLCLKTSAITVAELELDGLAVCYFNKRDNKRWEVAFLTETELNPKERHFLNISVEKKNGSATVGDPYYLSHAELKEKGVRRLELEVLNNGSTAHYTEFEHGYFYSPGFEREPFAGDPQCHRHDFRWVVDFAGSELDEQHGGFNILNVSQQYSATVLKVPHALFYTKEVTKYPMLMIKEKGHMLQGELFGHTNELVGARVLADSPSDIRLIGRTLDGVVKIDEPFPYQEGHHYRIVCKNMEEKKRNLVSEIGKSDGPKKKPKLEDYASGDFDAFYEVIKVKKGERYNLWGPAPTLHTRGKLGDCNMVRLGPEANVESLDYLLGQEN